MHKYLSVYDKPYRLFMDLMKESSLFICTKQKICAKISSTDYKLVSISSFDLGINKLN